MKTQKDEFEENMFAYIVLSSHFTPSKISPKNTKLSFDTTSLWVSVSSLLDTGHFVDAINAAAICRSADSIDPDFSWSFFSNVMSRIVLDLMGFERWSDGIDRDF